MALWLLDYLSAWGSNQGLISLGRAPRREGAKKMQKLNPPTNFRMTVPRCCLTCQYHGLTDEDGVCRRAPDDDSVRTDEHREALFHVCDGWRQRGEGDAA